MSLEFHDVACTVCGCVCDDLTVRVAGGRITHAERACALAEPWFLNQDARQPPAAEIHGTASPLETALEQAAAIMSSARSPLIYGLSRSSTAGQRAATRLADRLGATIDTTASRCHAPSIMAIQEVGESTCTLGEVKNRSDLVIFWGVNPAVSHPRHFDRYSVDPTGLFVPRGRADRTIVTVDVRPTDTTAASDRFIQVEPGRDFEVLWALRSLVQGITLAPECDLGAAREPIEELAAAMKSCRSGVIFFGLGVTQGNTGHRTVEALLRLVTDLNAHTRFYAKRMRVPGDVAGADSVLCWQTGYPFSVNLARGYPRYNPGEYSANEMLERGEADACLLVGSEGIAALSPTAQAHLGQLPLIVLDYPTVDCPLPPAVRFTTAVYGIHRPGTAYRMDEVPIPLRPMLSSSYPGDEEVLEGIIALADRKLRT